MFLAISAWCESRQSLGIPVVPEVENIHAVVALAVFSSVMRIQSLEPWVKRDATDRISSSADKLPLHLMLRDSSDLTFVNASVAILSRMKI